MHLGNCFLCWTETVHWREAFLTGSGTKTTLEGGVPHWVWDRDSTLEGGVPHWVWDQDDTGGRRSSLGLGPRLHWREAFLTGSGTKTTLEGGVPHWVWDQDYTGGIEAFLTGSGTETTLEGGVPHWVWDKTTLEGGVPH